MGRLGLNEAVSELLTATSGVIGQAFFEALARTTARTLGVRWALVGELLPTKTEVRTLAAWDGDHFLPSFVYPLLGTPCADVTREGACQFLEVIIARFPDDLLLAQMGAQSYAGVVIPGEDGRPLGVLAALDDHPATHCDDLVARLGVFAGRAGLELERRLHEEQRRQHQKVELLGQLAGGVIHDVNNLLTPILGLSELLVDDLAATPHHDAVVDIHESALRAQALLRSVLAFSRREVRVNTSCEPSVVLANFAPILRRMVPTDVALTFASDCADCHIAIDGYEFEQLLLNLVLNAKDACIGGGRVEVACTSEGGELIVAVRDDGCGIAPELATRVFEPFFTTKAEGRGTGLGLAVVATTVRASDGSVDFESSPGRGTLFRLRLPCQLSSSY